MAFKRFDGFSGSAPQKKIDAGVPVCPFCGENPHWLLEIQGGFFKSPTATCMCEKCQAKVKMESKKLNYSDSVEIVDTGRVNKTGLPLGVTFTMVELQDIASKIAAPSPQSSTSQEVLKVEVKVQKPVEYPDAVYCLNGGVGDILYVFDDRITIKHKGVLNFFAMGIKGDKTIYYTDITAIQFKKAGALIGGHIQFTLMGGTEDKGGAFSASGDENTITINSEVNELAEEVVSYMNNKIREFKTSKGTTQVVNNISAADELLKFKQLLDAGIITQEEFDKKKQQLLGL